MMVTATTHRPTPTNASTATDGSNAALNYNAFLQLLMAEMRNQDPTQPTDPAQSLSQLASFSSVEQSIKINSKLDNMLSLQGLSQGSGLIGRTISNADGSITGVVKSITVASDGVLAELDNGQSLVLGPGIKVS